MSYLIRYHGPPLHVSVAEPESARRSRVVLERGRPAPPLRPYVTELLDTLSFTLISIPLSHLHALGSNS